MEKGQREDQDWKNQMVVEAGGLKVREGRWRDMESFENHMQSQTKPRTW